MERRVVGTVTVSLAHVLSQLFLGEVFTLPQRSPGAVGLSRGSGKKFLTLRRRKGALQIK